MLFVELFIFMFIAYLIFCIYMGYNRQLLITIVISISLLIIYVVLSLFTGIREKYTKSKYPLGKKNRVVVSFTTLPSRMGGVKPVIDSILKNTVRPDVIYLNIPKFSRRENVEYKVDDSLLSVDGLKVNIVDNDYGPVTKLFPVLELESDPETVIICIDDDIVYDNKLIDSLLRASEKYEDHCICLNGWNYIDLGFTSLPLIFPYYFVRKVDILQCYGGVLYKRKFFDDISRFRKYMSLEKCFTTDDIMISKYLKDRNIDILMVPDKLKNRHINSQRSSALSIFNSQNNQWIKCIRSKI